jgi:hypothetical protein
MGLTSFAIPPELKADLASTSANMEILVATLGRVEKLLAKQNKLLEKLVGDRSVVTVDGMPPADEQAVINI